MRNILTDEKQSYIAVKFNKKGEPQGVLTRKTSKYGTTTAISAFNLGNLSDAIRTEDLIGIENELSWFMSDKIKYNYSDFKFVKISINTIVNFCEEFSAETTQDQNQVLKNSRILVKWAKEWAEEWRCNHPEQEKEIWIENHFGLRSLVLNPDAAEYYQNKLRSLNWERGRDYTHASDRRAFETFVRNL